jgi:hypothetical protein
MAPVGARDLSLGAYLVSFNVARKISQLPVRVSAQAIRFSHIRGVVEEKGTEAMRHCFPDCRSAQRISRVGRSQFLLVEKGI